MSWRLLKLSAFLLLLLLAPPAQALRCKGHIVDLGEHASNLKKWCGEPYWVERYSEWIVLGENGPREQRTEQRIEDWYYNFGESRFLRRLRVRDSRVIDEAQFGYGSAQIGTDCDSRQFLDGITSGEIVARCGPPASTSSRYRDRIERSGVARRVQLGRIDTWQYELPSGNFELILEDGVLVESERIRD